MIGPFHEYDNDPEYTPHSEHRVPKIILKFLALFSLIGAVAILSEWFPELLFEFICTAVVIILSYVLYKLAVV